jgi:hypothetical protein
MGNLEDRATNARGRTANVKGRATATRELVPVPFDFQVGATRMLRVRTV